MEMIQLTCNGIHGLIKQSVEQATIQLLSPQKMKTSGRLSCMISDGFYKIKGFIAESQNIAEGQQYSLIKIKKFALLEQMDKPYAIVIHICQKIDGYQEQLGKPIDYPKQKPPKEYLKQQVPQIQMNKLSSHKFMDIQQPYMQKQKQMQQGGQIKDQEQTDKIIQLPEIEDINLGENQRIVDLYPDLIHWQIIVILVKKNYKEFTSKAGKETKVLNLQLMDSAGMKITAAMFGDESIRYYKTLKEDNVYQISKGKIKQDFYAQNKGPNHSSSSLLLTSQTQFKAVKNRDIIAMPTKKYQTLKEIYIKDNGGQTHDIAVILIKLRPQTSLQKGGKQLFKQSLEVCDPVNKIMMEVIIWNKKVSISENMIGKTIALNGFRLNIFNDIVSLSSSYNSSVNLLHRHEYRQYEGKIIVSDMEYLSEKKTEKKQIEDNFKNLKELSEQLQYIQEGKQVKSTLNLIINLLHPRNWYYQGCPTCRKSAQPNSKCNFCGKIISVTVPHYRINVEMSDCTGSIWATGFQQFGSKLFEDIPEHMNYLKQLPQQKRQQIFEKYHFKQFCVSITSKLDKYSNVKHTITKIVRPDLMGNLKENVKRIKGHLSSQ